MRALADSELRNRTVELRSFLAAGTALDDLLVEAYAVVREAARRVIGLRPYDVQLVRLVWCYASKYKQSHYCHVADSGCARIFKPW